MLTLDYPDIVKLFPQHLSPKRSESASFLIWFLENYYRLDTLEAIDAVCDQRGDKGIDGIYVNQADSTIDVFQSKIHQKRESTVGDTSLREFYGTLAQFRSEKDLNNLLSSAGDAEVAHLVKRLDLIPLLSTLDIRGVYLSNANTDSNGNAYLTTIPEIVFIGKDRLTSTYIDNQRTAPLSTPVTFDVSGFSVTEYIVDKDTRALIAPIKAKELVKLQGIADQSLFDLNVRGALGRTQVNRDIVASIKDLSLVKKPDTKKPVVKGDFTATPATAVRTRQA